RIKLHPLSSFEQSRTNTKSFGVQKKMNRVFKTKWSVAHQGYVVTDEHHASRTKSNKSVVALAVATCMFAAGTAFADYHESGFLATSIKPLQHASQSWETKEYQKDWGLGAMNASTAYALGYHGQGVAVGVMDSGALLQKHPELAGNRFHASHNKGEYGSTGNRYPQGALPQFQGN
ncbi:serine protease, partial [gut metagenome]